MKLAIVLAAFAISSSADAQEIVTWKPNLVTWQGVGCQFSATPNRPQDAWVIAAGTDLSLVFTKLGSEFRTRRRTGEQVSNCRVLVPAEIAPGYFVEQVNQTVIYGIAKTPGVDAFIHVVSNFARTDRNGESRPADLRRNVAEASVYFPSDQAVNVAVGEMMSPEVRVERDRNPESIYARLCQRNRPKTFHFISAIRIRSTRTDPAAELSVAVDGLDVRYLMGTKLGICTF